MKKTMISIRSILLFASTVLFISCKKDQQLNNNSYNNAESFMAKLFDMSDKANGTIFFQANSDGNKSRMLHDGYVSAVFYRDKDRNKPYFPYSIAINNLALQENGTALAFQAASLPNIATNPFLRMFGSKVKLRLVPNSGNGVIQSNVFETDFSLPSPVYLESDFCKTGRIDNDYPIDISWRGDIAEAGGKVYIGLMYEGDYARTYDGSNVPTGTYLVDFFEVEDVGQFSIPQSIFSYFPVGSRCSIFIARTATLEIVDTNTGLTTAVSAFVTDQKETMYVAE